VEQAVAPDETDLAATVAAQVTQALFKTATPSPSVTPVPPTETATPSPTVTPTYAPPVLKINENTNCRSGPGENYGVLVVLKAGQTVELVGRGPQGNYWVVKIPNQTGTCWAWGEFATASGSTHTLDEMTPPPTATAAPPAAPRGLTYDFACTFTDVTVNLSWTDVATDESGYRILRNGGPLVELPANATLYTDTTAASSGSSFTYSVEAFNSAGKSSAISISFTCP
jgi:titin